MGICEKYRIWCVWKRSACDLMAMDGLGGEVTRMRITGVEEQDYRGDLGGDSVGRE